MTVKLPKTWTNNKKSPTNPDKKEQHLERKSKKEILHHIKDDDWDEQLREYYASQSFQE